MSGTDDVARVFDAWAREGRDEGMAERHRRTAAPVLEPIAFEDGLRMLDLGCGNGWAARYAARRGARAVGVDAAADMLARGARARPRVGLVRADFTALPFASDAFEVAFSMEALYYADAIDAALEEACRVLEPGARLHALVDYYEGNPASEDWPEETGVEMHRLSDEGWASALEAAGFDDVGTQRVHAEGDVVADWKAEHGSLYVHGTA